MDGVVASGSSPAYTRALGFQPRQPRAALEAKGTLVRGAGAPCHLLQAAMLDGASPQRGLRSDRKLSGLLPIKGLRAGEAGVEGPQEDDAEESESRCDIATKVREAEHLCSFGGWAVSERPLALRPRLATGVPLSWCTGAPIDAVASSLRVLYRRPPAPRHLVCNGWTDVGTYCSGEGFRGARGAVCPQRRVGDVRADATGLSEHGLPGASTVRTPPAAATRLRTTMRGRCAGCPLP